MQLMTVELNEPWAIHTDLMIRHNLQKMFGKNNYQIRIERRGHSLRIKENGKFVPYVNDFDSWYKDKFMQIEEGRERKYVQTRIR